jgi:hypothetical protein
MVEEYNENRLEKKLEYYINIPRGETFKKIVVSLYMRTWSGIPSCYCKSSICVCERQKYNDFLSKTTPKEIDELFNKIHTSLSLFTLLETATTYINTFVVPYNNQSESTSEYQIVKKQYLPYLYD